MKITFDDIETRRKAVIAELIEQSKTAEARLLAQAERIRAMGYSEFLATQQFHDPSRTDGTDVYYEWDPCKPGWREHGQHLPGGAYSGWDGPAKGLDAPGAEEIKARDGKEPWDHIDFKGGSK